MCFFPHWGDGCLQTKDLLYRYWLYACLARLTAHLCSNLAYCRIKAAYGMACCRDSRLADSGRYPLRPIMRQLASCIGCAPITMGLGFYLPNCEMIQQSRPISAAIFQESSLTEEIIVRGPFCILTALSHIGKSPFRQSLATEVLSASRICTASDQSPGTF